MSEYDLVQLENYPTLIAAEVAKSTLELSGIEAVIFDGETANMNWLYTNALGGVKLMVKPADLEAAREILKTEHDVEDYEVSEADIITASSIYCSKCHSKDIEIVKSQAGSKFSIAKTLGKWFGGPREFRCRNCGNTWRG